jgi:PAS domain S-box-containing protein
MLSSFFNKLEPVKLPVERLEDTSVPDKTIIATLLRRVEELERELSIEKARCSAIIDHIPFPSWLKDEKGKYLLVNDHYASCVLKSKEEIIGKTQHHLFTHEQANEYDLQDQKVHEEGKDQFFVNSPTDKFVAIIKHRVTGANGECHGLVGMTMDLSEERALMRSLEQEKDFLQALLDNIPHTIYFKDEQCRFTRINKAQARIIGVDNPKDAIGKTDFDFFQGKHPKEAHEDELEIIRTGIPLINKEEKIRTSTGEYIWVVATKYPIRNHSGVVIGIVGMSIDITRQRLAEQHLLEAKQKAEESDRLKTAFLANMSHEIRTPMNGIIGFSNLLRSEDLCHEEKEEYLDHIEECGNSLLNIIDDIIDISKIESGHINIREGECHVNHLLIDLFETFDKPRTAESRKNVDLVLKLPEHSDALSFITDPLRLKQVITNLISNALKFTEKGSVEFGYRVNNQASLEFYVKDTGIGIPEDKQDIIFDRFGQVRDTANLNQNGTGLGLAISMNLVKLMGGEMWVQSRPMSGSTFCFTLPFRVPGSGSGHTKENKPNHSEKRYNWADKKFLIAEDEEHNWIFLRDAFGKTKAKLTRAKNGEEAIELFKREKFDLILMDFQMPMKNGFEATVEIRQVDTVVPIIAQTAYAIPEERLRSLQAGCTDYISKPIKKDFLFEIIDKLL